jgi:hypothetical protein
VLLVGKAVAQSRGIEENTLGAQVSQVGIMLDNTLRQQSQALFERQRLRGAFRKHVGRFPDLIEVGPHQRFGGRMQFPELYIFQLTPLFSGTVPTACLTPANGNRVRGTSQPFFTFTLLRDGRSGSRVTGSGSFGMTTN